MATEVARLPLRDGCWGDFDLGDSKAFQDTINTLEEQQGFQRVYWGPELTNPNILRFFVDWDSVEDHIAFTESDGYAAFMDRLREVVDLNEGRLHHVRTTPYPPLVLSNRVAPVTEIWLVSFPASMSEGHQRDFEQMMSKFLAVMEKQQIFRGAAGGWVLETLDIGTTDSEMYMAYQLFIGWQSFSAVLEYQETSTWINAYRTLEDFRDLRAIKIVYYSGTQNDKDSREDR